MAQQIYQKYGAKSVDFAPMIDAQKAAGQSIKEALSGVQDMMDDAEKGYIEENTLNMQSYLKDKIKAGGLGADPIDQIAIKQKFGSMINMDQLDKTISGTKKELETDAINTAGQSASQILNDTKDPIKARRKFTEIIKNLGGSNEFNASATNAWSITQATAFTDIKAEKVQRQNASLSGIMSGLTENGSEDAYARIELALKNEDPKDIPVLRKAWRDSVEDMAGVTKEQSARNLSYLNQRDKMDAIKLQELRVATSKLTSQSAALQKNYIPTAADNQLALNTIGFGQSMLTAVDEELGWFNSGDVSNIKAMRTSLINQGIPDPEAERIMTHVFGLVYDGGSWHGNNLSSGDITQAKVETARLAKVYKDKASLDGQISDAANAESEFNLKSQLNRAQLQNDLTLASRDRNVMHNPEGSSGVWNKHLAGLTDDEDDGQGTTGGTDKNAPDNVVVNPNDIVIGTTINQETGKPYTELERLIAIGKINPGDTDTDTGPPIVEPVDKNAPDLVTKKLKVALTASTAKTDNTVAGGGGRGVQPGVDYSKAFKPTAKEKLANEERKATKAAAEKVEYADSLTANANNMSDKTKAIMLKRLGKLELPNKEFKVYADRLKVASVADKIKAMDMPKEQKDILLNAINKVKDTATNTGSAKNTAKTIAPETVQVNGEIRKGGSRSWRNNNRGNVRYTKYMKELGATGKDENNFAIFPDQKTGDAAMERLLLKGNVYKDAIMSKAIASYAPNSENDTAAYVKIVLNVVGGKDKKFRDYTHQEQAAILQAMRKQEGYEEGTTS